MRRVAFLTMDELGDFVSHDHLLVEPFLEHGWKAEMVPWRRAGVEWDRFDACLIRSPWDYQDDPDAFLEVLARIDASNACLHNSLELVRWNMHKSYLGELADRGVGIVPTTWGRDLSPADLERLQVRFGECVVVKPPVSANADDTIVVRRTDEASFRLAVDTFAAREYMVQPFLDRVCSEGEYSTFVFDGAFSHAILKRPKADDFRVQEEHGAQIVAVDATPELRASTAAVMSALESIPLYARVDFVRAADGRLLLMELELIEPSLYFEFDAGSPRRFAEAFAGRADASPGEPAMNAT